MSIRQFLPLITWHGRPRWISCPWKKALILPGHTTHWWSRVPDKPFKPKRGGREWRQMSLHCVPTDLCRLARIGALLVLHQFESKKKDTDTKKTGDAQGPFTLNESYDREIIASAARSARLRRGSQTHQSDSLVVVGSVGLGVTGTHQRIVLGRRRHAEVTAWTRLGR